MTPAIPSSAKIRARAAAGAAVAALFLPAAAGAATPHAPGDPFEGFNRAVFKFNQALDRALIRPLAITYVHVVPKPLRQGLHHAVVNLGEPVVAINDILQVRPRPAAQALTRFAANSTFGLFGLFDVAGKSGLPHHANDFGLTLARYGVKSGPYLFVPVVGPSTVRDGFGGLVNLGLNPLNYSRYPGDVAVGAGAFVSEGLYKRAQADADLKTLSASATDVYASLRSFYLQNRRAEITGGKIDLNALPDFDVGPAPAGAVAAPAPEGAVPPAPRSPEPPSPATDAPKAASAPSPAPPADSTEAP